MSGGELPGAVGAQVELELALPGAASPERAAGQVFAYDAATDRLVLRQAGSTPFHSTLRILKGAHVTGVVQLKDGGAPLEPVPAVDVARCREREEKAVRAAEAEAAKIGVGVSRLAQVMGWECMCGQGRAVLPAGNSSSGAYLPALPVAWVRSCSLPLHHHTTPHHTAAGRV